MKLRSFYSLFFLCLLLFGCSDQSAEPAPVPEYKKQAVKHNISQASVNASNVPIHDFYLSPQYSNPRTQKVTHVMIHFISNAIQKPQDPYDVKDVYRIFLTTGTSTNYMIGRNGEIYRMVSEDRVAFHAGKGSLPGFPEYQNKMNEYSLGIEMLAIGTRDEMLPVMPGKTYDLIAPSNIGYTDVQYRSLNRLLDDILKRHPAIQRDRKHIVGHNEYAPGRKTDPGKLFDWSRINISQPNRGIHTIQKGESIWLIAQKYGTSIQSIAKWNNIDPNDPLQVGQQLKIPNYTVKSGDTLWKIAQKFGVSTQTIIKYNNLNPSVYLKVGQKLMIPQ
jgi:N-acetyl-anhydromuramyl-L-alanine amidase AmpD